MRLLTLKSKINEYICPACYLTMKEFKTYVKRVLLTLQGTKAVKTQMNSIKIILFLNKVAGLRKSRTTYRFSHEPTENSLHSSQGDHI